MEVLLLLPAVDADEDDSAAAIIAVLAVVVVVTVAAAASAASPSRVRFDRRGGIFLSLSLYFVIVIDLQYRTRGCWTMQY
jgi:hypothetical protein